MSPSQLLLGIVIVANIGSALLVVRERQDHRQAFVELSRLEKARDELNVEFGRLQLEQATWAEARRVDQLARQKLGMVFPRTEDIVVVRP